MLFEKWTHFGKQNGPGVERTLIWSKHQAKCTDGEECIMKTFMKKWKNIHSQTSVRQYDFLTGHSLWNWSKAQQCQPIPLEHQKTTWSFSPLTATHSLCTEWNHTWSSKPLWLHKWQKKRQKGSHFLFWCYHGNENLGA